MIDNNDTIMYEDGIRLKIEMLNPHPTEVITLFYNLNKIPAKQIAIATNYIQEKFPDNKVVVLPDVMSLESCSKDVLENIISMISEVIEKL